MNDKFYIGAHEGDVPYSIYMSRNFVENRDFWRDTGACFVNEEKDICRQIIDPWGNIRNFPGIDMDELLQKEFPAFDGKPIVRSRARFGPFDGERIMVVWTIRTDGREWMDHDGFGEESYCSVRLYSFLDANGDFTQPFRLYAIGDKLYGEFAFTDDINRQRDRVKGSARCQ